MSCLQDGGNVHCTERREESGGWCTVQPQSEPRSPLECNPSDDIFAHLSPHESWSRPPARDILICSPLSLSLSLPAVTHVLTKLFLIFHPTSWLTSYKCLAASTSTLFVEAPGIFKFKFHAGKFDEILQ